MISFEAILPLLQPHLQELELLRLKTRKRRMLTWVFTLAALIICVALFMTAPGAGAIVVLFSPLVILAIGLWGTIKKFKRAYKQRIITAMIQAVNPGLTYNMSSCVPKATFSLGGIFTQRADRYTGEDCINGRIGQTDVTMSELHCQYRTTDSKGRTQYHTFFKGLYMVADFHKNFTGKTVVLPDTSERLFGGFGRWLQKINFTRGQVIYMENPEFEKQFVVYGDDQIEARYILTPNMIERIMELRRKLDCKLYLSFVNSTVHVAIHWQRNLLEPEMNESVLDTNNLREPYDELAMCFGLVDDLNLNTRIWSKQTGQ